MNLREIKRRVEDAGKKNEEKSIGFMLDALQQDAPNRYIKYLDNVVSQTLSLLRNEISGALDRKIRSSGGSTKGATGIIVDPTNRDALEKALEEARAEVANVREEIAKYRQGAKNPFSRHESEVTAQSSPSNTAITPELRARLRKAIEDEDTLASAFDEDSTEYKNLLKAYQESKGATVIGKTVRGHTPLEMQYAQTQPSNDDKPTVYDRYAKIDRDIDAYISGDEDAPEVSTIVKEYKKTNDLANTYFTDVDFKGKHTEIEKSALIKSNKNDDPRLVAALRLFSEIEKNDPDLWNSDELKKIYTDYIVPIFKATDKLAVELNFNSFVSSFADSKVSDVYERGGEDAGTLTGSPAKKEQLEREKAERRGAEAEKAQRSNDLYADYNAELQPLFDKLFKALTEGGDNSIINRYLKGERVESNLNRIKMAKELAANIKRDPFAVRRNQEAVGSKGFRISSLKASEAYDFSEWVYPNNFYLALGRALVTAFKDPDTFLNRRGETTFEEYISGEDRGWRSFKATLPTSGGVPVNVEITGNEIFSSEANLNTKGEGKGGGYVDIWVSLNGSVMEFNRGNGNPITAILSKIINEESRGKLFSIANTRNHNMKESQFDLNRAGGISEAKREAYELTQAGRLYGILGFFAVKAAGQVDSLEGAEGVVDWRRVENYLHNFPESILSQDMKKEGNAFFSKQLSSVAKQKLTPETKETLDDIAGDELDGEALANSAVILYHFAELAPDKVGLGLISDLSTGDKTAKLSAGAGEIEGGDGTIQSIIRMGGYGTTATGLLTAIDENDVLSIPQYFIASALNMVNNDDWTILNWGKKGIKGVAMHGIFEASDNFLPKGISYSVHSGNDPQGLGILATRFEEVKDYSPEQIEQIKKIMKTAGENASFRLSGEELDKEKEKEARLKGYREETDEEVYGDSRKVLDGRGTNLSTYISSGAYKEWYKLFDAEGRLDELRDHHLFVGMSGYLLEFDFSYGPDDAFVVGWHLATLMKSMLEGKARESATTFEATRTEMGRNRKSGMDVFNEAIDLLYKHQGDQDFFDELLGNMIDQGLDLNATRKGEVDGLLSTPGFKDLSDLNKAILILLTHFGTRLDPAAYKYDLPTTTELEDWFGPFKEDPESEEQGPALGALLSALSKQYPSMGRHSSGKSKPKPKKDPSEEDAEANLALAEARQEKENEFREWIRNQGDLRQAYARIQQKELDGDPTTPRERYLRTLLTRNRSNGYALVKEYVDGDIERNQLKGWESRKNIPDE